MVAGIILDRLVGNLLDAFPLAKNCEHAHNVRIGQSRKACRIHVSLRFRIWHFENYILEIIEKLLDTLGYSGHAAKKITICERT